MKAEERDRHDLYIGVEEAIGPKRAATLMAYLSPVSWPDVATKKDLEILGAAMKKDLDHLSAATQKELENHRAATKTELDHLSETLLLEIEASADRVRADLLRQMNLQTRTMIFALLAAIFTVAGIVGSLAFSIR